MLGDVNLFLSRASESDGGGEGSEEDAVVIGEVNIMVAVPAARGRGVGGAVLRALMWYVARSGAGLLREWIPDAHEQTRGVGRLVAKIDEGNGRSVELFRRAGFRMVSEAPNYFGEVEMAWEVEERAAGGDGGPQILEYVGGDYDAEEGQ
jgi:L-amino acid N-acyltransferase YncA